MYWRRRAIALGALLTALLLLIWLIAALTDDERPVQPAAVTERTATTRAATSSTTAPSSTAPSSIQPSSTAPSSLPVSSTVSAGVGRPPAAVTTPSTTTPAPPQPCPDPVIALAAQVGRPEYRVGEKPEFRLAVTNTGQQPCVRDLDASLQELLVLTANGTRLWSSNDCYPGESDDVRVLKPGEQVSFRVVWAGRTSNPQCAGRRVTVQAGDYLVTAKLGPLTSPPVPFRLIA